MPPGETSLLLDVEGAGNINHIWIGIPDVLGYREVEPEGSNRDALQRLVLEMHWDGEDVPQRPRPARRVLRRDPC